MYWLFHPPTDYLGTNMLPDTNTKYSLWNLYQCSISIVFSLALCRKSNSAQQFTYSKTKYIKEIHTKKKSKRDLSRQKKVYMIHLYLTKCEYAYWKKSFSCTLTSRHYLYQLLFSPCWPWFS